MKFATFALLATVGATESGDDISYLKKRFEALNKQYSLIQKEQQAFIGRGHQSFAQRASNRRFAVGMEESEPTGESISLKDHDVVTVRQGLTDASKKFGAEDLGVRFFAKGKKWATGYGDKEQIGDSSQLRDADVVTMADPKKITQDPKSDVHGATPLTVKYLAKNTKKMNLAGRKFAEGYGPREQIGESSQLRDADVVTMVDPKKITMDPKSNEHGAVPLTVHYIAKKAGKVDPFLAQKRKFKSFAQEITKVGKDDGAAATPNPLGFELAGERGPALPKYDGDVKGEKQW